MTGIDDLARRCVPFALPTVEMQRALVLSALDRSSEQYAGGLNQLHHSPTPGALDHASTRPDVDIAHSLAWLDLRTGPVVVSLPPHESERYMSAQVLDLYAYVVGYASPRTGAGDGATLLVRGPSAPGPDLAVDLVLDCPTDLCLLVVRTQVLDGADVPAVRGLQDALVLETLGAPSAAPTGWPAPVDVRAPLDVRFLEVLNWMLRLMPPVPQDAAAREDLAILGCGDGKMGSLLTGPVPAAEVLPGLARGQQDAFARCASATTSAGLFGSRASFGGDYLAKPAGACVGIPGQSPEECVEEHLGPVCPGDRSREPLDGRRAYTLRFQAGRLPPVDAFWSVTLYDARQRLYENPLDRYRFSRRQMEQLGRDADGSITLLISHERPAPAQVPNWLPAPAAPFSLTFRSYLPGGAVRDGTWTAPRPRPFAETG